MTAILERPICDTAVTVLSSANPHYRPNDLNFRFEKSSCCSQAKVEVAADSLSQISDAVNNKPSSISDRRLSISALSEPLF